MPGFPTSTRRTRRRMKILGIGIAVGVVALAPAAAQARKPVTRSEVASTVKALADQSAGALESNSFAGIDLSPGEISIDRSRTGVSNYERYGKYRMRASFALFGTRTVGGVTDTMLCLGQGDVIHARTGATRVLLYLSCPVS